MTGFIVFETHGGSRLSDYWQQKTKSRLSRVHVTPRKTLFTPNHALVDLALLAPGRMTRKNYLHGGVLTLHDTWLGCVKGRDNEEWTGETIFDIEACAHVPTHSLYVQGLSCTSSVDLDPSHASSACQAEENVVCNFKCMTTQVSHCGHFTSRSAVSDAGAYLPCLSSSAVHSLALASNMPGAPTKSTADNMTASRQKVGPPSILGADPTQTATSSRTLRSTDVWTCSMACSASMNGRFFRQKDVKEEFWTEDPTALTELLVNDVQWCEQHFRKLSNMLTMLLHHSNDQQLRNLRRNRIQGDIVLIDFLQTDVMKRNLPRLCPASLWALAHCMDKKRFTFATVTGTNHLRGDANFLLEFNRYLEGKRVHPAAYELVTIASCTGHLFVITREIPEGESDDIDYLTVGSYVKYGSICHGTHLYNDQGILRNGLDVDYGVRAGLSARNMIHFCVATNQRLLKHQGLYCYLDLKVAIGELGLKVMYPKTAQVVLVKNRVPPQALCLTWKSPSGRPHQATWPGCRSGADQESGRDLQGITFASSSSCFWTIDFFACDNCRG